MKVTKHKITEASQTNARAILISSSRQHDSLTNAKQLTLANPTSSNSHVAAWKIKFVKNGNLTADKCYF